jgi:selenocysteine lyase/cysteine desulfurase
MIGVGFSYAEIPALSKNLADAQVYVSFRGEKMRIAPHLYNDAAAIDRLFEIINSRS